MFNKFIISLINIIVCITLTSVESQVIRFTPFEVNKIGNVHWPDVLNTQNREWRTVPNNDNSNNKIGWQDIPGNENPKTNTVWFNTPSGNNPEQFPFNNAEHNKLSNDGNYDEYVFGMPTLEASDGSPSDTFRRFATIDEFPFKQQSKYCDRRPWLSRCKCFYMWVTYCWPDHNHPLCVCSKWCRWW